MAADDGGVPVAQLVVRLMAERGAGESVVTGEPDQSEESEEDEDGAECDGQVLDGSDPFR